MKKIAFLFVATIAAMCIGIAGDKYGIGETGELMNGGIIKAIVLASTNASQTATVKAVYRFPIWGTETRKEVHGINYSYIDTRIETLTNWCDWATDTYTVDSGVTNYYAAITVITNTILNVVNKPVTNTVTVQVITGEITVTNSLYSLTASGGVATNTDKKIVGAGGRLLVEGSPVTIFWE